jgi:ribosomal protein L39E
MEDALRAERLRMARKREQAREVPVFLTSRQSAPTVTRERFLIKGAGHHFQDPTMPS